MRASTIIILAVCLFSVAFANNNGPEPANNLGPSNSLVGAADESNNKREWLSSPDAAAGKQPQDPKVPKKPKLPKVPKLPEVPKVPKLPEVPKVPKLPEVPKIPKLPKVPKISNEPTAPESVKKWG